MEQLKIDVYGIAEKMICAGCDGHGCGSCTPGEKRKTIDLFREFESLLETSEFRGKAVSAFWEITPETIARNEDVNKILSMAELDPVIVFDGKIAYMGGFSPDGLLGELRKRKA